MGLAEARSELFLAVPENARLRRNTYPRDAEAGLAEQHYAAMLGTRPSASATQGALEALRQKELVWKGGRGVYAVEDGGFTAWLLSRYPSPPVLADDR